MDIVSRVLDWTVSVVSPQKGVKRARARSALETARRAYDGAKTGRLTNGWISGATDSNAEIASASIRLRNRARDLVRNNPHASRAVDIHAAYLIGAGIRPIPKADTVDLDAKITDVWNDFAESCDANGRTDFYGIQALVVRSMVESGECLVQFVRRPSQFRGGLGVPLQLRVLECDHLDTTKDKELPGGGFIENGVEYNADGDRLAYWLYQRHPGSTRSGSTISIRIAATEILHIFKVARPGQNRGVTWFAPVMRRMRDLDDYDLSELIRKKTESAFTAVITGAEAPESIGDDTNADGTVIETLEPGTVQYLEQGQDIKFTEPSSVSGYAEYMGVSLHAVAAGMCMPYELMTGDLSKISFSSVRAGFLAFHRMESAIQNNLIIPQLCYPVWNQFYNTALAKGLIGAAPIRLKWAPQAFESVDPVKDETARLIAVRAGFMSPQQAVAEKGNDWDDVTKDFAAFYEQVDANGMVINMDARKTTDNGLQKLETINADANK